MAAVLGVATLNYVPYALFNLASPVLSVIYGFTGFRVESLSDFEATARATAADREATGSGA